TGVIGVAFAAGAEDALVGFALFAQAHVALKVRVGPAGAQPAAFGDDRGVGRPGIAGVAAIVIIDFVIAILNNFAGPGARVNNVFSAADFSIAAAQWRVALLAAHRLAAADVLSVPWNVFCPVFQAHL